LTHAQKAGNPALLELQGMPNRPQLAPDYRARDDMLGRLRELQSALEAQGVRHAALFGSVARGNDVPESDVDIILDFDPERHIGLFQSVDIQQFLESELGRDVDLGTMRSLHLHRRDDTLSELVEAF